MVARARSRARWGAVVAAAAVAVAALGTGISWAADTIRASPLSNTYTAQTYDMAAGEVPTFINGSVGGVAHDVAATANGPDGKFLFKSAVIGSNQSAPVRGTQYLPPGTYRFFCTVHGSSMSANLRVGHGNPDPRPRLAVTLLSRSIAVVRRSDKLAVRLADAGSDARGTALVARLGGRTIATKRGVAVAAGTKRTLRMALNRRGRKALEGRRRAAVTVKATVPFGVPDTTRRVLD